MLTIRIRNPYYPTHEYEEKVPLSATIQHLKEQLEDHYPNNPPVGLQRLIFEGRQLLNEERLRNILKDRMILSPEASRYTFHLAVRGGPTLKRSYSAPSQKSTPTASTTTLVTEAEPQSADIQAPTTTVTPREGEQSTATSSTTSSTEAKNSFPSVLVEASPPPLEQPPVVAPVAVPVPTPHAPLDIDLTGYDLSSEQKAQLEAFYQQKLQFEYSKLRQTTHHISTTTAATAAAPHPMPAAVPAPVPVAPFPVDLEAEAEEEGPGPEYDHGDMPLNVQQRAEQRDRRGWMAYFDLHIAFRVSLTVLLFGREEEGYRFLAVVALAAVIYLFQVGVISDFLSWMQPGRRERLAAEEAAAAVAQVEAAHAHANANANNANNNNDNNANANAANVENGNAQAVEGNVNAPVAAVVAADNTTIINSMERFIVGFFASLYPSWQPPQANPPAAAPAPAPAPAVAAVPVAAHEHQD